MLKLNNKEIVSARLNSTNISLMKINGEIVYGNLYVTNPELEFGEINQNNGKLVNSNSHLRTKNYLYIKGKPTLTITNNASSKNKVFCYDQNKNFIKGWLEEEGKSYNYKYVVNGASFTFPDNVYYVKCRFHATENPTLTINYS